MLKARRLAWSLLYLSVLALSGCATLKQLAVLRTVSFAFAGVSDVRVAGVSIGEGASFSRLSVTDAARLGAAVVAKDVPLEMVAHVSAANPKENTVRAQMVGLDWTLFIEDRRMLSGGLTRIVAIDPGNSEDVPLSVRLDLLSLGGGGARDLYDAALAVAGQGSLQKDLRLELVPTIETPIGPMRFPAPVVVKRGAATH